MSTNIHSTAVIEKGATIGSNSYIGPYCCVGKNVILGDNVRLVSHVAIDGHTTIGEATEIFPFASIGLAPQDLKYDGEESKLLIGKNNKIREYVTIQPGTREGKMLTQVGDNGLYMAGVHVAHDCIVGNSVIMANNATLSGHVTIGDHASIGGLAAVHQFVRIGHHAFIGGMAGIKYDVIPYALVMGRPANLAGLNIVGLKRGGTPREDIDELLNAYAFLFDKEISTLAERTVNIADEFSEHPKIMEIVNFIQSDSSRALCIPADKRKQA